MRKLQKQDCKNENIYSTITELIILKLYTKFTLILWFYVFYTKCYTYFMFYVWKKPSTLYTN
jgi:hypothetical protein